MSSCSIVPREEMDRRIDERVDRMVERGLVDEVRALLAAGYHGGRIPE
jgi:tRNA dimethylallyltransferase